MRLVAMMWYSLGVEREMEGIDEDGKISWQQQFAVGSGKLAGISYLVKADS